MRRPGPWGNRKSRWALPVAGAIVAMAVGTFASGPPAAGNAARQADRTSNEVSRAFAAGGSIRMHLGAGDYRLRGSKEDRIRVRWSIDRPEDARKVRVQIEANGTQATVHTSGPHNNFRVEIDVPGASNLYVRLSAGDLRVVGIKGDQNIQIHAGDLRIDVGRPEMYNHVDASVQIGDIDGGPFQVHKSGFWRSFEWTGNGKYRLHAHVGTGDIRLYEDAAGREVQ
jgi:hypothetical protein